MQANYAPFIDRMISRYEGGYGWDKSDPGGPTKYGVTCYDYAEFRGRKMTSMAAWAPLVKAMTLQEAEAIYQKKYASALKFDMLPGGVDCCMMDYGVNSGVARPIRVARSLLHVPGGNALDLTLFDAIVKTDAETFINMMCDERLRFMKQIRTWPRYKAGWSARVADLRAYSERLARGYAPTAPLTASIDSHPKAVHTPTSAGLTPTGGAVATAVAAHTAGAPLWLAAGSGALLVVAGLGFDYWQRNKAEKANAYVG